MGDRQILRGVAAGTAVLAVVVISAYAQAHGRWGFWDLLLAAPWPFIVCKAYLDWCQCHEETHADGISSEKLVDVYRATTEALASAIAAKDSYCQNQISRVQHICELVAEEIGLDRDTIEGIRVASLIRDAGKLGVPDYILLKPGPLDPDEFAKMRNHAAIGAKILEQVDYPWNIAGMVRHHHEKYDGSGYPDHLKGEQIPLGSRIIYVGEVYDALVSDRCYREGWSHAEAIEHIERLSGSSFDPQVVRAFLAIQPRIVELYNSDKQKPRAGDAEVANASCAAADSIAQANRELVSLFEIAQTLSSTLELDEVLALLAHRTRRLLQASTCAVFLVDRTHPKNLVARAVAGRNDDILKGAIAKIGKGVTGKTALHREPHVGNFDPNDLTLGLSGQFVLDLRSSAVVPIVSYGELLGTINLYDVAQHAFSNDSLRMLTFVAHQAGLAIQNASTFEEVRDSSLRDPLTNLHNGRFLRYYLERELSRCSRLGEPLSVLGIDLNSFKLVNDQLGHQTGDTVLREVADILRRELRDYDVIVRVGGDEFVVVLPGTPAGEANRTAARIRRQVANLGEQELRGIPEFGASVGMASYPSDACDTQTLLARADAAMYRDKRSQKQGNLAA